MASVDWQIRGPSLSSCNCDIGCPCQFNSLPTHGDCRAAMVVQVDKGHFGDVSLDGLRFGVLVAWPGPIHEGRGEAQPFVDENASPEQRDAVLAIISGEHTDPGATIFNVFAATFDKVHEPLFTPIQFEVDIEARTGRLSVPGVVDVSCNPIRNPITGESHRARIDIPDGFEYTVAEVADGTATTGDKAAIDLDWQGSHAHLIDLHWTQHGVVH
ncbi:MAG: DUF1326 domain-containing protein [Gammaproteobacteria bacterium]